MSDSTAAIQFYDHGQNQEGVMVVRRLNGKVALCLSLEKNGDVEAVVEIEVLERIINVLQETIR